MMDEQENVQEGSFKRQPKPQEQALVEEFSVLTAQYGDQFPHICEYVKKEATRIGKGYRSLEEEHCLDVESEKPVRMTYRVTIPVEKYPNFNYVGRLLGPKGATLRGMQEISGCKMAILGKGSMKDKNKEEQCRLEGGKYAHLNEELHVWIQAFGIPDVAFYKLYVATKEVKKYLHADYNDEIFTEQMMMLEQDGTIPKGGFSGRGMVRGGRGGRGMRGGRGGVPTRGGMGGGMMGGNTMGRGAVNRGGIMRGGGMRGGRGVAPRGGAMRGGRGMHRGGAAGGVTESLYEDVYEPAPTNFNQGYENGSSSAANATSYFEEFPEPGNGSGDTMNYQRQSQGGYGAGNEMMQQGMGAGMDQAGMDQGGMGMGGLMGMTSAAGGMGSMKRGMEDYGQTANKFARRY